MAKVRQIKTNGEITAHRFKCPGCTGYHAIATDAKYYVNPPAGEVWEFNGDLDSPTFSPSVLLILDYPDKPNYVCHSFVKNGSIEFLSDCTHQYAGLTLELPEI